MQKSTVTATAGYFAVAAFLLMRSLPLTGLGSSTAPSGFVLGMGLGFLLLVLAVLSWLDGQSLDSLVFFLVALMVLVPASLVSAGAVLWFVLVFLGMWMAARSGGAGMRFLFLLLLDLAFALMFLADVHLPAALARISADVAVLASFAALYYAVGVVVRDGCGKKCLPFV
jgi:hypothetical protein